MFRRIQRTGSIVARCKCDCSAHGTFLTAKGLREAAQREVDVHGVDNMWAIGYLDKVGSVSALTDDGHVSAWPTDVEVEEQYRRFHNGS